MYKRLGGLLATLIGCLLALASAVSAHEGNRVLQTRLVDGERVPLTTHGDPRDAFPARAPGPAPGRSAPLQRALCEPTPSADDAAHATDLLRPIYKVVYAYPSDQPSRLPQYGPVASELVEAASETFGAGSDGRLRLRVDRGTPCGPDFLDVAAVRLPRTLAAYESLPEASFYRELVADTSFWLGDLPKSQRHNLLVFADYLGPAAHASGQAVRWGDDRPGTQNLANRGGIEAVVYGWGGAWFTGSSRERAVDTVVHEVLHNLGAVQDSAPHSTLAAHCFDEWDIECYADKGPRGESSRLTFGCGDPFHQVLDCGRDDYFDSDPAAGSYLQVNWNAARSLFLCRVERCDTAPQAPTARVSVGTPDSAGAVVLDGQGSTDDDGSIIAWRWVTEGGAVGEGELDRPSVHVRTPGPGTYRARLTVTDDEGIESTAVQEFTVGRVEAGGPTVGGPAVSGPTVGSPPLGSPALGNVVGAKPPPSVPARPRRCRVPRLRGVRLVSALRRLRRAGCRARYRRPRAVTRKRLRVRTTRPRAGAELADGHRVVLRLRVAGRRR